MLETFSLETKEGIKRLEKQIISLSLELEKTSQVPQEKTLRLLNTYFNRDRMSNLKESFEFIETYKNHMQKYTDLAFWIGELGYKS